MDGPRDGTDVCPLRGDERRMCSFPERPSQGRSQSRERGNEGMGAGEEDNTGNGVGASGIGQMVKFNEM